MNHSILTIDPGASGGFAYKDGLNPDPIEARPMFKTEGDIADYLRDVHHHDPHTVVYLEKVDANAGGNRTAQQGLNFGRGYGFIIGCCAGLGLRLELITPQKWQKLFPCGDAKGDERKQLLKAHAQRLYPHPMRVTGATQDALLIMEWVLKGATEPTTQPRRRSAVKEKKD